MAAARLSPFAFAATDTLDDRLRVEVPDRIRPDAQPALLVDDEPETGEKL